MKKVIAFLFLLLVAILVVGEALGQSVGASQIRKKVNGGVVADTANALAVGIFRGTNAPISPVDGQLWLDTNTTPATLRAWNGTAWERPPASSAVTQADLTSFPASPSDGQIIWVRNTKRALLYDASDSKWYFLAAVQGGTAQPNYSLEAAGYSSAFLAAPGATSGAVTTGGSVSTGTHVCATTFYNSAGGETMPGTATASMNATAGNQTLALTIPTGGTGVVGRRVWCSKANQTNPLFLIATVNDNSTTTYSVTVADGSFGAPTAPDVDFSAPVPSGWTVYRPATNPETIGGCGSTGASLLCAAYRAETGAAGASGVRLLYAIGATTSGAMTVQARIKRFAPGFTGSTGVWTPYACPFFVMSTSATVAAPEMKGVELFQCSLPLGSGSATLSRTYRSPGSQWASSLQQISNSNQRYRFSLTTPMYLAWDHNGSGTSWTQRARYSSNGTDWSNMDYFTSSVDYRFAGVVLEKGTADGTATAAVIEFDNFTHVSY